jgi:hypothetical protein
MIKFQYKGKIKKKSNLFFCTQRFLEMSPIILSKADINFSNYKQNK